MRILWAAAAWAICLLSASQLIKHELVTNAVISWLIASLPVVTGTIIIFTYRRYIHQADELQRMIHLRALAMGFAAGWLAISCYPLFERIGAPEIEPSTFGAAMAVTYALGVLLGGRRFW